MYDEPKEEMIDSCPIEFRVHVLIPDGQNVVKNKGMQTACGEQHELTTQTELFDVH